MIQIRAINLLCFLIWIVGVIFAIKMFYIVFKSQKNTLEITRSKTVGILSSIIFSWFYFLILLLIYKFNYNTLDDIN